MNLFHKLNLFDIELVEKIKQEILIDSGWFESNGFKLLKLDRKLFRHSDLLELMIKHNGNPHCIKMDPMTWYDWHIDENRQCTVNMMLEGTDSKCFFGDRKSRDIVNLTELPYEIGSAYLLNTQVNHAVLNLNNVRYMLSIGFNKPNSYNSILEYCKLKQL